MTNQIDVSIDYDPNDISLVGLSISSRDGSSLTAQQIIDAVSEALLYHFQGDPGSYGRVLDS